MSKGLTYKKAGVNIEEANKFIKDIGALVRTTRRKEVLTDLGQFGGCFLLGKSDCKNPVLVSSTDGVGTKIKIAILSGKHDTLGIDLVAMNVNDILAMGAEPLFFLDYIATGSLNRKKLVSVVKGIVRGCKEAGCTLIGGETAEMPVLYKKDEYDLAGFCVGVVEKSKIITGARIKTGDILVGIESTGLHSNGYSLVHKVFSKKEIKEYSRELLRPTRIYVKPVLSLLKKFEIKGIAHITGGAFYEKLTRIFPKQYSALIKKGSWPVPKIFSLIQKKGNVSNKEMFRTFNMGIGMVVVVDRGIAEKVRGHLTQFNLKSWIIGEVVEDKA
ncbi:MAG: phosphoribosylformylglycinamidine cyclo-ligase, partial [Candidatus Omnitrophica bacterium]|nr:phosphoribosylformylglycinamidine cyclo-ligase [Candidatus Omnitrophota bacterium]